MKNKLFQKKSLSNLKIKLLSLLLVITTTVFAQIPPSMISDSLQKYLDDVRNNNNSPGGVMSVYIPNQWVFNGQSGLANTQTNLSANYNMKFRIGSITKHFTACAIMKLASQNILALNDSIGKWLPQSMVNTIPYGHQMTIRQLLNHTSGIEDGVNHNPIFKNDLMQNLFRHFTIQELINYSTSIGFQSLPECDTSRYSNTNYNILSEIIRNASGMTYKNYITQNIISPLSLNNTYIPQDSSITLPFLDEYIDTSTVTNSPFIDITLVGMSWSIGDGDIISSTSDLNTYLYNFYMGNIIPLNWVDTMIHKTVPVSGNLPFQYGSGNFIIPLTNGDYFSGHNGMSLGTSTSMFYIPSLNAYLSICLNRSNADPTLEILLKTYTFLSRNITDVKNDSTNVSDNLLYPNPTYEKVYLLKNNLKRLNVINIYDSYGKLIMQLTENVKEIDLSMLSEGIYFIQIQLENGCYKTQKVLKKATNN